MDFILTFWYIQDYILYINTNLPYKNISNLYKLHFIYLYLLIIFFASNFIHYKHKYSLKKLSEIFTDWYIFCDIKIYVKFVQDYILYINTNLPYKNISNLYKLHFIYLYLLIIFFASNFMHINTKYLKFVCSIFYIFYI